MNEKLKVNINELQKHFIEFLNDGKREISHEETEIRRKKLELDYLEPPYLVVRISSYFNYVDYNEVDEYLYDYMKFCIKAFKRRGYVLFSYLDTLNNVVMVISLKDKVVDKFEKDLIKIREEIIKIYNIEVHIAVGGIVNQLCNISESAHDAEEMLIYKYQYMIDGIANISNALLLRKNKIVNNNIYFERVIGSFVNGDFVKMEGRLNELIEQVRSRPNMNKQNIKYTMIELVAHILHIATNNNINVEEILEKKDFYSWILEQNHTEVLIEWFMNFCRNISNKMNENIDDNEKQIIQLTKKYIDENISDPNLGLQLVASNIGLSQSYFSQMFKKETGIGLNVYIKYVRIMYAQKLLVETDLSHTDIAIQTGFTSSNYFIKYLKKKWVFPQENTEKTKKICIINKK